MYSLIAGDGCLSKAEPCLRISQTLWFPSLINISIISVHPREYIDRDLGYKEEIIRQ